MDWVPITRDCFVFGLNVTVLVIIVWDEKIYWYEAMILLILAIFYYITMFQSHRISKFMKRKFEDDYGCCNKEHLGKYLNLVKNSSLTQEVNGSITVFII